MLIFFQDYFITYYVFGKCFVAVQIKLNLNLNLYSNSLNDFNLQFI